MKKLLDSIGFSPSVIPGGVVRPGYIMPLLLLPLLIASCTTIPLALRPSLVYEEAASGCADFTLYKGNGLGTEWLWIAANREQLGLSEGTRSFDLASVGEDLQVGIDLYSTAPALAVFCNDVVSPDQVQPEQWKAVSGTATVTVNRVNVRPGEPYNVTVTLENVTFLCWDNYQRVVLREQTFENVTVGWLPG